MGTTDRIVILIDMDCFYCQVEEKLNPHLEGKPIAVVQYNAWRGGGIIAVNYPARDEGVTRHMRGNEAKKKCPSINLVQVPEVRGKADLAKYREAGKRVADVLATFTPLLQRASVDEAYLDVTDLAKERIKTNFNDLNLNNLKNTFVVGWETKDFIENVTADREFSEGNLMLVAGGVIAEEIRHKVYAETGYKCSAGIAHNKILAKLVCGIHKPNKQTILPQEAVEKLFETIKISKIKSLGGKFGERLSADFKITYMNELAQISEKELTQKYDAKTATFLYNIARGIDLEPVTTKLMSKSIACCKNFQGRAALTSAEDIQHWLGELATEIHERLDQDFKENNREAKQLVVMFAQEIEKKEVSSTRTISLPAYDSDKITKCAFEVVQKNCMRSDGSYHVKFLGLNASHFNDVKKVRKITHFFHAGQNKPEINSVDSECNNSNSDTMDFDKEENIYCQTTQELQENVADLIFYDCNLNEKNDEPILDVAIGETSNRKVDVSPESQRQSSASFFTKYFCKDPKINGNVSPVLKYEQHPKSESSQDDCAANYEDDTLIELCPECEKRIPKSELQSHNDYHFALKLVKIEDNNKQSNPRVNDSLKKKSPKSKKRKKGYNNNQNLMTFFRKETEDPSVSTEICPECLKKIKIDEFESHKDYHIAKKIHLEINSVNQLKPVPQPNSIKKPKIQKKKNQTANQSVISFLKPSC